MSGARRPLRATDLTSPAGGPGPADTAGPLPLATADLAFLAADSASRPLDYALILHFDRSETPPFDLESLRRGAESARRTFPVAASRIGSGFLSGPAWRPLADAPPPFVVRQVRDAGPEAVFGRFLDTPFRLAEEPPIRQLLAGLGDPPRWSLVVRAHHIATDLIGTLLFVRHQLRVARGASVPKARPEPGPPSLRRAPRRSVRNPGFRTSTNLATLAGSPSPARRWRTVEIPDAPHYGRSRLLDGFTWNDALLAAALEAMTRWNERCEASTDRIGLWVPMNLREPQLAGFGNGASRIRVHRDPGAFGMKRSFLERCRAVRREVEAKKRSGEWALPSLSVPAPLAFLATPLLRRWLDRPWADFGTAGFTHLRRWPGDEDPAFGGVAGVEVVACLHHRHPIYFVAMPHRGRTFVTITWDPALLAPSHIEFIAAAFRGELARLSLPGLAAARSGTAVRSAAAVRSGAAGESDATRRSGAAGRSGSSSR